MKRGNQMKNDLQISQETELEPIVEVASKLDLKEDDLELYGKYKAKINFSGINRSKDNAEGHLILVTSINPTPAGEGKSTITVGLGDALNKINKKSVIALREPSLGPVMGIKGGAAGGGYAQVLPMEDINLHFTGDMHAITTANNALSALLDNHIHQGNELNIDARRVIWKRVVDLNDRELRKVIVGLGGPIQGVPREDGFDITVASEIMAILCLAADLEDLKARLARIVVGYTFDRQPVTAGDLKAEGALALLLKDAIKPNLVQTIYGTPAFVHGGPFANIAHGCNSILATKTALRLADYVVTEAGFGADLGGEKFLDIKVPNLKKAPDAVVIVATVRALKMHGGMKKDELKNENLDALKVGFANLKRHIRNMEQYQLPVIVAKAVVRLIDRKEANYKPLYRLEETIQEKTETIVKKIYGGNGVVFSKKAQKQIEEFTKNGWDKLPICMAKTQYSFSDDPSLLGAPEDFTITIREIIPKLGAGFLVALTGDVMTMPGLPKKPAALNMDVTNDGEVLGLF